MTTETVEVFYSYAPNEQDEDLRRQLDIHLKHLERLGLIAGWYRNKVNPGAELELEVERHFLAARVILLLVSPDFMASDYCYGSDMQRAMERHSAKQACVIPILLRPVHYKGALFEKLRVLPSNAKPITNWANLDEAFSDVARGISQVIESLTPSWQRRSVTNLSSSHDRAMWMVPHRRNPFFTGREELLINLRNNLIAMNTAALSQPQSINGLGGVGKTQIAIEYAYRHRYEYDYVLWARAATSETLIADFAMMAEFLHLFEREESDKNRVITVVKWWLATHSGWLLILDNADDLETIYDFLPKEWSGHIILTTRIQATGPFVKSIEVEPMEKKEGSLLLLRRAKVLELNETLDQAIAQDCIAAEAIVAIMGGLPLALDQAAAYIEETGCRVPTYLKRYHQRQIHLLKRRGGISSEHPEPVTMTWSLSFEKVRQASLEAADLLRLCAFLAPDAIPEELLIEGASELGSTLQPITDEPSILDEAIGVLRRFSLIHKNNQTDMLSIHRLIQTVLKEGMDEETQKLWAERAIKTVNLIFPSVEFATWSRCQKYLPHAQVCTMHIQHYKMAFPEAARLFLRVGLYLYSQAKFSEAQLNYQSALLISEQVLGEEHFDTADILDNLARLYHTQGKHSQAEQLYRRALLIREKVLGLEHSDTAISLDNLALLYSNQGRYTEAEE
ncbi:MAG TPA: tetratricopeptide repeat protein, partial [Ktedonobacteraceae bacterium]|nr:tetratricopeptide repeat protein [Ktedonobacteraceae bacterium]